MQSPPAAGRERQHQPSVCPEAARPAPLGTGLLLIHFPWHTPDWYLIIIDLRYARKVKIHKEFHGLERRTHSHARTWCGISHRKFLPIPPLLAQ